MNQALQGNYRGKMNPETLVNKICNYSPPISPAKAI